MDIFKNLLKNKKALVVIGVLVAGGLLTSIYLLTTNKSKTADQDDGFLQDQVVEEIKPEDVGLTMEANASKKSVRFAIDKAEGITTIEYQVVYEADSTAAEQREGGESRVQRGITGEAMIKSGEASYQSEWLDLGSCSKNVCRYDSGVKSVTLTLKIVKEDGKVYQVEKTLEL